VPDKQYNEAIMRSPEHFIPPPEEQDENMTEVPSQNDEGTVEAREVKDNEIIEKTPQLRKAERFWEEQLEGERRIEQPMDPECRLSIVVPVSNEDPERLLKQIDSLRNQQGVDRQLFELIYVINNGKDDGTPKFQERIMRNQQAMDALRGISDLNVFAIDKSTPGNEIENCNVGKARNRGVAEASLRFHEAKKNGILLQTDADTWFQNPEHIAELLRVMEDPQIIGAGGGIRWEWSPDTKDSAERADLERKLKIIVRRRIWTLLANFIRDQDVGSERPFTFSGAHMISRSLETAEVGGLIDANIGEDPQFGFDLTTLANARGNRVENLSERLVVTTAYRESDRTDASFKKVFDKIRLDEPETVPDVLVKESVRAFELRKNAELKAAFEAGDKGAVEQVMMDPSGRSILPRGAMKKILDFMDTSGKYAEIGPVFRSIQEEYGNEKSFVELLYERTYHEKALTAEYISELRRKVEVLPGGKDFLKRMDKDSREKSPIAITFPSGNENSGETRIE
jgi:glycosyltransferase involved in cell wall biosynthesis